MRAPRGYELGSAYQKDVTGVYYRAVQLKLDRPVTMKVLRPDLAESARGRKVFGQERRLVTSLEHPNLLLAMDTGTVEGRPYFITESTAEPTLAEALKGDDPLIETRAVAIALGVARALHHLAGKQLIYKNVTPRNVLLPRPAAAKLITFRYIKPVAEAQTFRRARVQSGQYCAPELSRDDLGPVSEKTNVYALGGLLYHMLAGAPPAPGKSSEARKAHKEGKIKPLRARRPYMRDRAYAVVNQLMAHDPEKRVDTAAAVVLLEAYSRDPLVANPPKANRRRNKRR